MAWTVELELTVQEILRLPFYHPVIEEVLHAASQVLARTPARGRGEAA